MTPEKIETSVCAHDVDCKEVIAAMEPKNRPLQPSGPDPKWRFFWRIGDRPDPADTEFVSRGRGRAKLIALSAQLLPPYVMTTAPAAAGGAEHPSGGAEDVRGRWRVDVHHGRLGWQGARGM